MYAPPPKPKTVMPIIAGILLIIAGIDGMAFWGMIAFAGGVLAGIFGPIAGIVVICGAIGLIFGILALVGGVMATMRKMWALALVGSILGLFLLGFFLFEASLLSFIALILIAISRHEF